MAFSKGSLGLLWSIIFTLEFLMVISQSSAPAAEPPELPASESMSPAPAAEPPELPASESMSPAPAAEPPELPASESMSPAPAAEPSESPASESISPAPAAEPPESPSDQAQSQVIKITEALREAGQFGIVVGLLDGLQLWDITLMTSTTWLLPNDQAFFGGNFPANWTKFIDYHVIQELLPYSRLASLGVGTRLPTFLGDETVVVSSNTVYNFSLNNAMVIVRDLYIDSTIAVHGINAVLDDVHFNDGANFPPPDAKAPAGVPSPPPPAQGPSPGVSSPAPAGTNISPLPQVPTSASGGPSSSPTPSKAPQRVTSPPLPAAKKTPPPPQDPSFDGSDPSSSDPPLTDEALLSASPALPIGTILSSVMVLVIVTGIVV
ncbi:hypothetical protein R1flu_020926 [Riccia fluitans]|uniref:FAS1 domain-containing protein n=1 Tax=Riccia fluitans TaxID=41844 RepID=A0ABD1ZMX6_9MARC